MGCFEINNKENPKTKKHFEFIFIKIESSYTKINGTLRFNHGDWVRDVWYPWDTRSKTIHMSKNVDIKKDNLIAIIYTDHWIIHAAYGDFYLYDHSKIDGYKIIHQNDLPFHMNFSIPMDIRFNQSFTKDIVINESSSIDLEINNQILIDNITLKNPETFIFNASWTEYYSDYDDNEDKWYNATIDYSGRILIMYYGRWETKNIKPSEIDYY